MITFVDTSALYALLDEDDRRYQAAKDAWENLLREQATLVTTNYVFLETFVLLQRRFGLAIAREFAKTFAPLLQMEWVDQSIHEDAVSAVLTANRRGLSIIDCVSFAVMRNRNIWRAFTMDAHFREQGFECLPE